MMIAAIVALGLGAGPLSQVKPPKGAVWKDAAKFEPRVKEARELVKKLKGRLDPEK